MTKAQAYESYKRYLLTLNLPPEEYLRRLQGMVLETQILRRQSMKVLAACEESQRVCAAFRARGHEAYSCDIEPCSGGHEEWHTMGT